MISNIAVEYLLACIPSNMHINNSPYMAVGGLICDYLGPSFSHRKGNHMMYKGANSINLGLLIKGSSTLVSLRWKHLSWVEKPTPSPPPTPTTPTFADMKLFMNTTSFNDMPMLRDDRNYEECDFYYHRLANINIPTRPRHACPDNIIQNIFQKWPFTQSMVH